RNVWDLHIRNSNGVGKMVTVMDSGKMMLGSTERYGLRRPAVGPIGLKNKAGKTPVLDVGAFARIKSGRIKALPAVHCFTSCGAKFVDGQEIEFDSVILATG
ncbi:hypothetical protein KI387_027761, partial [Taxus chinensis]